MYDELGGDKLLQGFVDAGSADGKFYAAPYYSGARAVFYNKDAFAAAGVEVPTTLAEFTEVAKKLQTDTQSGFWFPGQDWYNGAAWIYTNGGDLAVKDGDTWKGALSSPESIKGLEEVQDLFENATQRPGRQRLERAVGPVQRRPGGHVLRADLGAVEHRPARSATRASTRTTSPTRPRRCASSSRPATRSTPVSSRCRASRRARTRTASPVARTSPSRRSPSTRSWPRAS